MNVHRIETQMNERGTLTLHDLPFEAGANVEVIVLETIRGNGINGAEASTRASQEGEESWVEAFVREVDEAWQREGERPDVPRDFAANFKSYKRSLISNHE